MFKMEDMIADMLRKAIPPEVMAMLTAEKLKEIGEKATAFVEDIRGSLDYIKAQNVTTHEMQSALLARIEVLENDNRNGTSGNSRPRGRKPGVGSGGTPDDTGSGSDNG